MNASFATEQKTAEMLQWNTFMGSSGDDRGYGIAVDGSGNVYVTGQSGGTWGSPINPAAGWIDAFVVKFNGSGVLQWNTFLGGAVSDDFGMSITVDGSGNVYVAGYSYDTWGSPVNAYAGGTFDAFAAKLNSVGELQWNTFLGSSATDFGYGIAVDGSGNVYVTGECGETWGTPVNAYAGGTYDAFAAKLNNNGELQWNTFMGSSDSDHGTSSDHGRSIAVDGSGNVYVAGHSRSSWGSPVNALEGSGDAFAVKLNSSGELQWNTFMGGAFYIPDQGNGIAVDGSGNVYVAGTSYDTWGSPVNAHAGWEDAFAVKLNNTGERQWNTFMGSSEQDAGDGIAVDDSGNVYVAGRSGGTWGSPVNAYVGSCDAFAAKLNSSGERQWNTMMGGEDKDFGKSIVVDNDGIVYIAGFSYLYEWGTPVNAHAGWDNDAFAAKLDESTEIEELDFDLPTELKLSQNYPNPFNALTLIKYTVPHAGHVTLKVYNILGEEIITLINEFQIQGGYEAVFDATTLSSGIYIYELNMGKGYIQKKKMELIR